MTNPAPSLYSEWHKAMTATPAMQRDAANARAQEAWQHVAELEACIRLLAPRGWLEDDTMEHMPGIAEARRLLARSAKS
jgi:hypothetical protein